MSINIINLLTTGEYTGNKAAPELTSDLRSVASPAVIGTGLRVAAAFFMICCLGISVLAGARQAALGLLALAGAAFWFFVSMILLARLGRRDYRRCAEAAGLLSAIPWGGNVRVRVSYRANQKPGQKWITNSNSTFHTLGIEGMTAGGVALHLTVTNKWSHETVRRGSRRATRYSVSDMLEIVLKPPSGAPDLMMVQAGLARIEGPQFQVSACEGGIRLTLGSAQLGPKMVLTVLDALHQACGLGPLADFAAVDALPEAAAAASRGLSKNASMGLAAGGALFILIASIGSLGWVYSYFSAEQLGDEASAPRDSSAWSEPGEFQRQMGNTRRLRREQRDAEKSMVRFGMCSCCTCPVGFGLLGAGMFFFMRQRRKNAAG